MNKFSKKIRVFTLSEGHNIAMNSIDFYNDDYPFYGLSFKEFNKSTAEIFKVTMANYAINSLRSLIYNLNMYPKWVCLQPGSIQCFVFTDVRDLYDSFEETRDRDYLEELYNFYCYLLKFIKENDNILYSTEYLIGYDNIPNYPIMEFKNMRTISNQELYDEDVTYYDGNIGTRLDQLSGRCASRYRFSSVDDESTEDSDEDF